MAQLAELDLSALVPTDSETLPALLDAATGLTQLTSLDLGISALQRPRAAAAPPCLCPGQPPSASPACTAVVLSPAARETHLPVAAIGSLTQLRRLSLGAPAPKRSHFGASPPAAPTAAFAAFTAAAGPDPGEGEGGCGCDGLPRELATELLGLTRLQRLELHGMRLPRYGEAGQRLSQLSRLSSLSLCGSAAQLVGSLLALPRLPCVRRLELHCTAPTQPSFGLQPEPPPEPPPAPEFPPAGAAAAEGGAAAAVVPAAAEQAQAGQAAAAAVAVPLPPGQPQQPPAGEVAAAAQDGVADEEHGEEAAAGLGGVEGAAQGQAAAGQGGGAEAAAEVQLAAAELAAANLDDQGPAQAGDADAAEAAGAAAEVAAAGLAAAAAAIPGGGGGGARFSAGHYVISMIPANSSLFGALQRAADAGVRLDALSYRGGFMTLPPPQLRTWIWLRDLDLSYNTLVLDQGLLASQLAQLTALTALSLAHNLLEGLPEGLCTALTGLRLLDVSSNAIALLPPDLSCFSALTRLAAAGNWLPALPPELTRLSALAELDVASNRLARLPEDMWRMSRLQVLRASCNRLTQSPDLVPPLPGAAADTVLTDAGAGSPAGSSAEGASGGGEGGAGPPAGSGDGGGSSSGPESSSSSSGEVAVAGGTAEEVPCSSSITHLDLSSNHLDTLSLSMLGRLGRLKVLMCGQNYFRTCDPPLPPPAPPASTEEQPGSHMAAAAGENPVGEAAQPLTDAGAQAAPHAPEKEQEALGRPPAPPAAAQSPGAAGTAQTQARPLLPAAEGPQQEGMQRDSAHASAGPSDADRAGAAAPQNLAKNYAPELYSHGPHQHRGHHRLHSAPAATTAPLSGPPSAAPASATASTSAPASGGPSAPSPSSCEAPGLSLPLAAPPHVDVPPPLAPLPLPLPLDLVCLDLRQAVAWMRGGGQLLEALGQLTALTALRAQANALTCVPDSWTRLTRLEELCLAHNRLACLPPGLTALRRLRCLDAAANCLTGVPEVVAAAVFPCLAALDLSANLIAGLPEGLGQGLGALRSLDLRYNSLSRLPAGLGRLTALRRLDVSRNYGLKELPCGVVQVSCMPNGTHVELLPYLTHVVVGKELAGTASGGVQVAALAAQGVQVQVVV